MKFLTKSEPRRGPFLTRWSIPFAGFLLALIGGMSYAWGVFIIPMTNEYGWSSAEAALPMTIFMIVFALVMVPAGMMQDKIGPKKVIFIGAILYFIAYGLASFIGYFPHPIWLVMTYSLIGGVACAMTYACVAPPARKWFPDRPGMAISLAVMGFGLAAVVIAPLKANYLIPNHGIDGTFLVLAVVSLVICLIAAWLIRNPKEGWTPMGWKNANKTVVKNSLAREEMTPTQVCKTPLFREIWLTFVLVIAGGLLAIGLIPSYGEKVLGLTPIEAAIAISIFAGFNGFGRPLAGFLSDRYGVMWVMIVTYVIQAITFLLFPLFAVTSFTLYIASALLGWGFAVTLALFPTLTSMCFGVKHMGVNYGLVFTAFGVGALSPLIGSWIFDTTGSFAAVFIFAGILTAIGQFLSIKIKRKYVFL